MTLAAKNGKCYLEVIDRVDGFCITASKGHAAELEPLFRQHGLACRREPGPERDALFFGAGADRGKVEEILLGYEAANGS